MSNFIKKLYSNKVIFILSFMLMISLFIIDTFEQAYFLGIVTFIFIFINSIIIIGLRKRLSYKFLVAISLLLITLLTTLLEYSINLLGIKFPNLEMMMLVIIVINYLVFINSLVNADVVSYGKKFLENLKIGLLYLILIVIFGSIYEIITLNEITIISSLSVITGTSLKVSNVIFANNLFPNDIFSSLGGIFIISGLILASLSFMNERKGDINEFVNDDID